MAISRTLPPCHRTKNKAFIDPDHAKDFQVRAAQSICGHCPLLKECASTALGLGAVIGRDYSGPADAVIMAGVICRGDLPTAEALASIAGVAVPQIGRQSRRAPAPDACRNCLVPMVSWTRDLDSVPAGLTVHHARGFCTDCRPAYNAFLKTVTDRRETRDMVRVRNLSHCRDCDLPMVPIGHVPPAGHVEHHGRGVCRECEKRAVEQIRAEALKQVPPEQWITYADASAHYGVSVNVIQHRVSKGLVSTREVYPLKYRYLHRAELEAVLGVSTCVRPPEVSVSECV